jgi:hypothetical protein
MHLLNNMAERDRLGLEQRFRLAMIAAAELFGDNAFRKQSRGGLRSARYPINKALFETWASHLGTLSVSEHRKLVERKVKLNSAFVKLLETDGDFVASISQGTGEPDKVKCRFRCVGDLIRRILK